MKGEFIVALRNDQHQLLVLEDSAARAVFPQGQFPTPSVAHLTQIAEQVLASTGLKIGGLHQSSSERRQDVEVYRFTAFVAGGKLHEFPRRPDDFRSASWMAPRLILQLQTASKDMLELVGSLSWTHTRGP